MNDLQQTLGKLLKNTREAKHISIGEVAQRLLLSKSTITALEEDDYGKISAQVYAEGYLKAYAQFLQIPAHTVLENFRQLNIYSKQEIKFETKEQAQTQAIKYQNLLSLLKGQCRGHVVACTFFVLILGILAIFISRHFFGKNTDIIHVPNKLDTNNIVKTDDQIPIITVQ